MRVAFSVHVIVFFTPYQDNRSPLFWASSMGRLEVVKLLLGAGADVSIARYYVSHCE